MIRFALFAAAFFALFACGENSHAVIRIPAQGRDSAKLYLPEQYASRKAWPLVLLLHGYTADDAFVTGMFHFKKRVSSRGFILLAPNGMRDRTGMHFWNATEYCCNFENKPIDDVAYLTGLVREVRNKYNVDDRRIYVVGHSNGGFMAQRLLCDTTGLFAASADLAGAAFTDPAACKYRTPVSALHVHAVDDGTIKYQGVEGQYPSAAETVRRLVERNSCTRHETISEKRDFVRPIPMSDTTLEKWSDCADGTEVQFWTIKPFKTFWHHAHVPWLTFSFSEAVLDFLFAHQL